MVSIESPQPLTGGQAVQGKEGMKSLVDWVQVTFKGGKTVQEILQVFGLKESDFTPYSKGFYGYPNMIGFANISVMYNDDMTEYHVQMTGQGCRYFEQVSDVGWYDLFAYIDADPHAKLTRLDLAIDDFKGVFTIPTIRRKMKRGELVTKFNTGNHTEEFKFTSDIIGNSPVVGDGVRLGSPTSRLMIRMYDKKLERENQGFDVTVKKWVRTELQFRKEYANEALSELVDTGFAVGSVTLGYLKQYVRFVDPCEDTNKRRWKHSHFWNVFIKDIQSLKLSLQAPDRTIRRSIEWLDHSIAPTLAMVKEAKGEGFFNRFVEDMLKDGKDRWKKHHAVIVKEHQRNVEIKTKMNKDRMNEYKRKMATIRQNRNQKQNEVYNRMVLKKYIMKNRVLPDYENDYILDDDQPQIQLFNYESK